MKKNEPFIYKFRKKAKSPMALVLVFLLSILVYQNGIAIPAPSSSNVKKPVEKDSVKEIQDDNGEENEDEEEVSSVGDQDDNTSSEVEDKDIADEEGNKEQLNEIVSEESKSDTNDINTEQTTQVQEKNIENKINTEQTIKTTEQELVKNNEENLVEVYNGPANVEVRTRQGYTSYKERRSRHGFTIGLSSENVYMHDYKSIYDGKLYEELWGQEDVSLPQINVNYKFNFMLGSVNIGAGYGHGSVLDDRIGDERTIAIDKTAGSFQILFDNFMKEPFFVPYFGVSLFDFKVTEHVKSVDQTHTFTTDVGNAYTVGFLIQLNWMDKDAAKLAYTENGLENTYLDIYWTQHENPNQEPDPSTQSDFNWGAGLRIEF